LSLVAGSLAEPLACSIRAVAHSGVKPQERLLILGAGPIGLFALAAARVQSVEQIIVSDVAPQRLEIAQRWGASDVINVREQDVVAFVQERYPGGVDRVIDAVGVTPVRTQAIRAVVPGGCVVLIGLHDEESVLPANYIIRQEIAVTGSFAYTDSDFAKAVNWLVRGVVQPSYDWLEERPLSDGPSAFAELVDGKAKAAKIVLMPAASMDGATETENHDEN
jgi:threonine dehydrogenase-like Zn-dependent dehydrogenase